MSEQHQSGDELDDYKEQDRFLPIANVARIMKKALPDNAKIAKEAKETVQECVSEFISFITSEGRRRCQVGSHFDPGTLLSLASRGMSLRSYFLMTRASFFQPAIGVN